MKLKFCANLSFMFQEEASLLKRYYLAQECGFKAVECASPYNFSVEEIVNTKNNAKVEQILVNIKTDMEKGEFGYAAIPGQEGKFTDSLNLAIKYAKSLNCKIIHIMSGIVPNPSEENDKLYENNIRDAVTLLEKEGIIGVIEPINGYALKNYYMNSYEKGLQIIKKINSPNLKLMMDLFHLQFLNGNLTNNITNLLPYVGHIQIAQVPNRNEPDTPGEIDYKYVFSVLEEQKYSGWIGLEYKPLRDSKSGLKWLQTMGYSL
uniref:Putative hydroxypyruvate isomerase n=1 Tax=Clastoptera arizonana TaxID=38151 RepID=A0A1B6E6M1_9HEMI